MTGRNFPTGKSGNIKPKPLLPFGFKNTMRQEKEQKSYNALLIAALLSGLLAASGCENNQNPDELFDNATTSMEAGDINTAIVQLKSILQTNPDHIPSRTQLGRLYLTSGDILGAQKELEYALNHGGNKEEIIPPLLNAYISSGKTKEATELPLDGLSKDSLAVAYSFQAQAYQRQGNTDKAEELVQKANDLSPQTPEVKTTTAAFSTATDPKQAESLLRDVVEENPDYAPAWSQLANIYRTDKNLESAEKAYDEALKLNPQNAADYIRRASLRIEQGNFDGAQEDLQSARSLAAGYYEIDFLQGVIHLSNKNYMDAQSSLQQAHTKNNEFFPVQYYLALNSSLIGQYDTALEHAVTYFEQSPDHLQGRLLLAQVHLKLEHYQEALHLLEDVANAHPENVSLLSSLADAYHGLGNFDKELGVLDKLNILVPDNQHIQYRRIDALFRTDQSEEALTLANELLVKFPDSWQTTKLIIQFYSSQQRLPEAVKAAEAFVRNNPDNANGYSMLGMTQLQLKDNEAAEKSFLQARQLSPNSIGALHNLASLAMITGEPSEARKYYQQALEIDKEHLTTLIKLAILEQNTSRQAFIKHLETAIDYHPDQLQPRYLLARYYLNNSETDKVLTTLGDLDIRKNYNHDIALLLTEYDLKIKDYEGASRNVAMVLRNSPEDVNGLFMYSQILQAENRPDDAKKQLEKALKINPDHILSNLANINWLLAEKQYDSVVKESDRLLEIYPDNPNFLLTKGKALAALERNTQAEEVLKQAYENSPTQQTLIPYASVLYKRSPAECFETLEAWLEDNSDDTGTRNILAGLYLQNGDSKKATENYEKVLKVSSDNLIALNNLAWEYRQKKPEKALEYAQKATSLNSSPPILDTLAVVLMHNNQNERALRTINQITDNKTVEDTDPSYFYHKAQILMALGKTSESRTILTALISKESQFSEKEDAQNLLKTL